ncbi:hypothetical protein B0O99DRAFT_747158 [Bisporella sp. PMI_857]|nr:hypothetical protein B0O99DRAFT_747158 [Bisporella sp. PMI_857]
MIAALVRDIEILEPLLAEIERDFDNIMATGTATGSAKIALSYCRQAMADLDALLEDLSVNLASSRKLKKGKAKMKVVLRKDVLDKCKDRLYMAMRLLDIARGLHLPELIVRRLRLENTTAQHRLEELFPETAEQKSQATAKVVYLHPTTKNTIARAKTSSSARWGFGAFGKLSWQYVQYNAEFNEINFSFNARLQFFLAFVQKAWDIQVSKATSGWNFNFKPYNIVPNNSLVIKYAKKGNIRGIRKLFYNKKASIYDRDTYGRSLLWNAASRGNLELMNLLITWGLDVNEEHNSTLKTPLHCLLNFMSFLHDTKSAQGFLILNNAYDTDGSLFSSMVRNQPFFTSYGRLVISSTGIFKEIQPLLWPHHYELPILDRLEHFDFNDVGSFRPRPSNAQAFRYILREDGVLREEDVVELQQHGINLLNLVVSCRSRWSGDCSPEWRNLCRDLIAMTTDLSYNQTVTRILSQDLPEVLSGTPLILAMSEGRWGRSSVTRCIKSINRRLKLWLEDLHACGVDLQKYGYREKKIFLGNEWFRHRWFGIRSFIYAKPDPSLETAFDNVKVKLIGFDIGPRPEDWVFHWDMDAERYAGQFWDLIENPPIQVPGSWVDDDCLYHSR